MPNPERKILSCRPAAYYYRSVAHNGKDEEVREALLRLVDDYEKQRAWVREQGMIPPRFEVPPMAIKDYLHQPASPWQEEVSIQAQLPFPPE